MERKFGIEGSFSGLSAPTDGASKWRLAAQQQFKRAEADGVVPPCGTQFAKFQVADAYRTELALARPFSQSARPHY